MHSQLVMSVINGNGLFVIGEARLRLDANLPEQFSSFQPGAILGATNLLALIQARPEDFIHCIKGNFVIVCLDEQRRSISLYNSRFGISPFYYALDEKCLIFSTSLSAVGKCLSQPPSIDPAALVELALFNYPLNDRTYFQQVKMLRPAEIVHVSTDGIRPRMVLGCA